jgi:NB-ARC domain
MPENNNHHFQGIITGQITHKNNAMFLKKIDTSRLVFGEKLPQTLPGENFKNFIGRESEINSIYRQLEVDKSLILQINGSVGVGKSALGLYLANRFQREFSVLELSYDFNPGYPSENQRSHSILALFIRLFEYYPSDYIDENLFAYNFLMKDKRSIVFLDNVSHLEQIKYLLPENNGVVIITSREKLDLQGAVSIKLEPLSDNQAQNLLIDIIGADKANESPRVVEEICKICDGYPEAIGIVGRAYATKSYWRPENYERHLLTYKCWLDWQNKRFG